MSAADSVQSTALEHLRVIRTLMERAHIYRAVSAPTALIGGSLALALTVYQIMEENPPFEPRQSSDHHLSFLISWLGILLLTGVINLLLLIRSASLKGEPVVTEGLRMALRAIAPPMLTGGILGCSLIWNDLDIILAPILWILCYGLALQATISFAPLSLIRLARAFLITGQVLAVLYLFGYLGVFFNRTMAPLLDVPPVSLVGPSSKYASLLLGLTFGVYHIIYGALVFVKEFTSKRDPAPLAEAL